MHPKTKKFADKLLKEPKISHTRAYLETHQTDNKKTANVNAAKLLSQPNVQIYMDSHVTKATEKVVKLIGSRREEIALRASQDVLDRTHGKPLVKTSNANFNINIQDALNELE